MTVQENRFARSVWRMAAALQRLERQAAAEQDVTPAQLRLLVSLARGPDERGVSDLAHEHGLDVSTMTRNLAQLEKRGWLSRQTGEQDRRTTRVSLTEEGSRLAQALHQSTAQMFERAFLSFHPSDRVERVVALDRVAAALEKLTEP